MALRGRAVWSAIVLALAACGGEPAASGASQPSGGGGNPPPGTPAPAACGSSSPAEGTLIDPSFELRATAIGPYAPGQEGRFEIALVARGEYHVNTDYPLAIHLRGPTEVHFPRPELGKGDAVDFGDLRARFQVPFTASAAGRHRVTAEVDFAVCTPESCMPDCRLLAIALPVEASAAADHAAWGPGAPARTTATP
jgi:hypothetical protein